MCVPQGGKIMCSLSALNYKIAQTFQKVITVATEILIPCFRMFNRTNIVFSFNGCVLLHAVFWQQSAQKMVTPIVWQDGYRVIGTKS
jgi:hypothetical protein